MATRLAARYRTCKVHLPGYGRSRARLPYHLDESHALVEETLRAKGIQEVHLVGFSGGAYRALALTLRKKLAVRSISLLAGFRVFTAEQRPAYREYARLLGEGVDLTPALPGLMLSATGQTHRELDALAESPVLDISTTTAPILARAGQLDAALPIAARAEVQRLAPHVTLPIVPDVGHTLLREDFEGTPAAIEAHLAQFG